MLETRDFYVCLYWTNFNLLVFNLFLLFAGEAGEAHAGQRGQRIGCMVRIEYGMGVPVGGEYGDSGSGRGRYLFNRSCKSRCSESTYEVHGTCSSYTRFPVNLSCLC